MLVYVRTYTCLNSLEKDREFETASYITTSDGVTVTIVTILAIE